jgi:hypothetical protein
LLAAWWIAVHALALASLPFVDWPWWAAAAAALAVLMHGLVRRPVHAPAPLIFRGDGRIAWLQAGAVDLELIEGTRFTRAWVSLRLRPASGGPAARVLLLADQLDPATWRTLLARLGRARAPQRKP